jgi:protocatechuate 3,4-dioxygenase beta subunit
MTLTRRKLLMTSFGTLGALAATGGLTRAMAAACGLTPKQVKGPFYPVTDQADEDNDLTLVKGATAPALGQVVYITGVVQDQFCKPVPGALVEIWQACATGRYNHPSESNLSVSLDPNFQYWGQATTAADGSYSFKTIIPGAYPADVDWWRPAHIHYKVTRLGYHELITQLYFEGDPYNDADKILGSLPVQQREQVIMKLVDSGPELDAGSKSGVFNLTIKKA